MQKQARKKIVNDISVPTCWPFKGEINDPYEWAKHSKMRVISFGSFEVGVIPPRSPSAAGGYVRVSMSIQPFPTPAHVILSRDDILDPPKTASSIPFAQLHSMSSPMIGAGVLCHKK